MVLNSEVALPLGSLPPGGRGEIVGFRESYGDRRFLQRLLEIGFLPGETVEVLQRAPFGGSPMSFWVKGAAYALRTEDADLILVNPLPA